MHDVKTKEFLKSLKEFLMSFLQKKAILEFELFYKNIYVNVKCTFIYF